MLQVCQLAISQGVLDQGKLFLTGVASGFVVWFFYDLLRLWRRLIHHGVVWTAVEDVMFFFTFAVIGFLTLYPQSLGLLRAFVVLAVVIGSLLYFYLLSPHIMRGGTWLVMKIRKTFGKVVGKIKAKFTNIPIEK